MVYLTYSTSAHADLAFLSKKKLLQIDFWNLCFRNYHVIPNSSIEVCLRDVFLNFIFSSRRAYGRTIINNNNNNNLYLYRIKTWSAC